MNKSLLGGFREVIHNNYTLYYFVYMYVYTNSAREKITEYKCPTHG